MIQSLYYHVNPLIANQKARTIVDVGFVDFLFADKFAYESAGSSFQF